MIVMIVKVFIFLHFIARKYLLLSFVDSNDIHFCEISSVCVRSLKHLDIIDPQIKHNISFSLVPGSWKICREGGHFCATYIAHTACIGALFRERTGVMKTA